MACDLFFFHGFVILLFFLITFCAISYGVLHERLLPEINIQISGEGWKMQDWSETDQFAGNFL